MERQLVACGFLAPDLHDGIATVMRLWLQRPAARLCWLACVHRGNGCPDWQGFITALFPIPRPISPVLKACISHMNLGII
ncbi:hypothetical protein [Delftia sp. ZNC0008]|uniref:hypothetical protein n=1 Tax=Delftia sp. ZNC0008 TaxID=1339242 RepID=UPI0012E00326|nr:hypothetical protein [Delftia sp. ZNC0008]